MSPRGLQRGAGPHRSCEALAALSVVRLLLRLPVLTRGRLVLVRGCLLDLLLLLSQGLPDVVEVGSLALGHRYEESCTRWEGSITATSAPFGMRWARTPSSPARALLCGAAVS